MKNHGHAGDLLFLFDVNRSRRVFTERIGKTSKTNLGDLDDTIIQPRREEGPHRHH